MIKNLCISAKALRSCMMTKSKCDPRDYLTGVCLSKNRMVSSDGRAALVVDCVDFKSMCGSYRGFDPKTHQLIIKIARLPPKSAKFCVLNQVSESIGLASYYGQAENLIGGDQFNIIDAEFPDVEKILGDMKAEETDQIKLGQGYLLSAGKVFDGCDGAVVKQMYCGPDSPVLFSGKFHDVGQFRYLLAQIRGGK